VQVTLHTARALLQHHGQAPGHSSRRFEARRLSKYAAPSGSNGLAVARTVVIARTFAVGQRSLVVMRERAGGDLVEVFRHRVHLTSGTPAAKAANLIRVLDRLRHLIALPDVVATLFTVRVGIEAGAVSDSRRRSTASRASARRPCLRRPGGKRIAGELPCLRNQAQQRPLVVRHLLEVRDRPPGVGAVAAKPPPR
jgi:hypothetical protein